jgi:hypothetical protein
VPDRTGPGRCRRPAADRPRRSFPWWRDVQLRPRACSQRRRRAGRDGRHGPGSPGPPACRPDCQVPRAGRAG